MESKNPFGCVWFGIIGAVVGGDIFPNNNDNNFIMSARNQPMFNKPKNGSLIMPIRITSKFQKKLSSSHATPQLKKVLDFVTQSVQLLTLNISNKDDVESNTFSPDKLTEDLTEFKLNKMKIITIKKNANNASRSLIYRI